MASESTPLVPQNGNTTSSGGNASSFYFLAQGDRADSSIGEIRSVQEGGEEIDTIPEGSKAEDFAARRVRGSPVLKRRLTSSGRSVSERGVVGWFKKLIGVRPTPYETHGTGVGSLLIERKAPIKIEPKVFFANERTFLAWLHVSIMLAGASIAIVAFADANPWSQLYGVLLLPVACSFICYSMWQYARRAAMIRRRDPGPYEDTVGPTVLGIILMLSIVAQFSIKLYSMM